MSLNHIISQSRRRTLGPSLDLNFEIDKSNTSRVGPTPTFSRASSGTFVNKNGVIVGKTQSTSTINLNDYIVGNVLTFGVPSGSVVGWIVGSLVIVMNDTNADDIHSTTGEHSIQGNILSYTDTTLTLIVTAKTGTVMLTTPWVSYRGLRIDHDPVTGACLGALLENGRTNNVLRSGEFSNASYWAKSRVTIDPANATTAPDGTTTADKIVETETATPLDHNIGKLNIPLSPQQTLTYSVFVKSAERSEIQLRMQENVNGVDCIFNLSTLAITPVNFGSGSGSTGSIVAYPNGWYRCAITGRPSGSTGTVVNAANFIAVSGNANYTGDGTSGIFIWGAQLEVGAHASSYIPTTSNTVIRAPDIYRIIGASFNGMYNQSEGTFFAEVIPGKDETLGLVVGANTNGNSQINAIYKGSNIAASGSRWVGTTNSDGVDIQVQIATATNTAFSRSKLAYGCKLNDFAFYYNGTLVGTDNAGRVPSPTTMHIGTRDGNYNINGHIVSVNYYPRRLNNSQLQALTTTVTEELLLGGEPITYINNTVTITI